MVDVVVACQYTKPSGEWHLLRFERCHFASAGTGDAEVLEIPLRLRAGRLGVVTHRWSQRVSWR
ncbi:hypothetical protein J2S57_005360 [Kineosporia succinea]|uniref:Uncharacterized protein n=1 Tax=Kineosporia succinea TaxID=84632 RepID=A0ABT9PA85_9ACTN|nr:hypothetical protein [Kineosporia succinea]